MKTTLIFFALIALNGLSIQSQEKSKTNIPVKIEELTAPQFETALEKSASTCIIPLGVLEKHGPHMPLGTDVFIAREIALRAAKKEYVPVFPFFYFGQIFEAKHQPGTFAYSNELIWRLLSETCQELARNWPGMVLRKSSLLMVMGETMTSCLISVSRSWQSKKIMRLCCSSLR